MEWQLCFWLVEVRPASGEEVGALLSVTFASHC